MVPLGSCEQHGHHLPVFVDSIQVTAIAGDAEKRLGDRVLLLPTLWLGSSHHHLDFPGTVSVLPSVYSSIIKSVAQSILRAGFRRIFFLNGHGGNQVPAAQALSELACESDEADDAYLVLSNWWKMVKGDLPPEVDARRVSHACACETSLILALRPELVAFDAIREGRMALDNDWVRTEDERSNRVSVFRRFHRLTASGSMGKPSAASADKGQRILDMVTNEVVEFICDFAGWPELPAIGPR